ncbi:MAG: tetratricopeptide repeat protein [Candidatus Riflebacteria bacterium]|nr:tetratricopeptide repeat protein [Candidatus Riflebacteria bacterium]
MINMQTLGRWVISLLLLAALLLTRHELRDVYHREGKPVQMGDTMAMMVSDTGEAKPPVSGISSGTQPPDIPARDKTGSASRDLSEALGEVLDTEHGPGFDRDEDHEVGGDGHAHEEPSQGISHGMVLLLKYLGLQELAANLLWIQMDADSHHELWHRVEFALQLIPTIDPHFVEAYLLHSFLMEQQGHFKESMEILQKGLRNNPYRSDIWVQIGVLNFNMKHRHGPDRDLEKALTAFTQVIRMSDCPSYIFRFRAIVLVALHRREDAIAYLEDLDKQPSRSDSERQQDAQLIKRIKAGENWE